MKLGKYDPLNKAKLFEQNPGATTWGELLSPPRNTSKPLTYMELSKMEKPKLLNQAGGASHARAGRGRKKVLTSERINIICEAIALGATEKAARIKAGISAGVFYENKKKDAVFSMAIQEAHTRGADFRSRRYQAILYESQLMRQAGRKAKRPEPTHQAKMVMWHLTFRVPLNFAAIPENEIKAACEQFSYSVELWQRQATVFGLMQKIYQKRAKLRGEQLSQVGQPIPTNSSQGSKSFWANPEDNPRPYTQYRNLTHDGIDLGM